MKKIIAIAVCAAMAVSMSACNSLLPNPKNTPDQSSQLANPFVACKTLDEAQELAGFTFAPPEDITGYVQDDISAIKDELIQVTYTCDESQIIVKKGKGESDISGNYNTFSEKKSIKVDGNDVTVKGDNGIIKLATWICDGYSFSIDSEGMSETSMQELIKSTH